jgi:hypothetical protein
MLDVMNFCLYGLRLVSTRNKLVPESYAQKDEGTL